jgi:hypothetical protein
VIGHILAQEAMADAPGQQEKLQRIFASLACVPVQMFPQSNSTHHNCHAANNMPKKGLFSMQLGN